MMRQVHPNSIQSIQHSQAEALELRCLQFSEDWETLKWEFAPNKASTNTKDFREITGKDDIQLAMLREKICSLVDTTKDTLEGRSEITHGNALNELTIRLDLMVKGAKKLRAQLEGVNGHIYRDERPEYYLIGLPKPFHAPPQQRGQFPTSSGLLKYNSNAVYSSQSSASASTLGDRPGEETPNPDLDDQQLAMPANSIKLIQEVQELEARNDYLEKELGSERYDKEELREDYEKLQAEFAKLNGGKRYRKPRPAYLEEALEASIDKANPWVRNSRLGEAIPEEEERKWASAPPVGRNKHIFSDPEDEEEVEVKRRKILKKKVELLKSPRRGSF
jgi:hypothetical protein